jgi:hypothetical protein
MRFMPDSAVLGTIGHAKRRAAKRKAAARRAAARSRRMGAITPRDLVGGLILMFVTLTVLALVA